MKKLILTLISFILVNTTVLNAGFFGSNKSKINASGNTVDATVDKSKIEDSNIGMTIKANGSTITANNNKVKAEVTGGSTIKKSNVGLNIVAERR